jgi:hypothetical protein
MDPWPASTGEESEPERSAIDERDRFIEELAKHRETRSKELKARNAEVDRENEVPNRLARALNWVLENDGTVRTKRDVRVFYVYLHRHPSTEVVFYVGKGVDARAWNMFDRRPEHTEKLYKLLREGHAPGSWVSIVKWGLTEGEALRAEDQLIRDLVSKGIDLANRQKPTGPAAKIEIPALTKEMRQKILNTLASVPADIFYLSMWELLQRLKVGKGKKAQLEAITNVREAFKCGIRGWFLDEYLYVRRQY